VAVIEDGNLEEFHAERSDAVSHVGNIYIGTVVNVEPAIQAAFVDFGLEANGFLHVSDLHPQYFPGETDETTERVGKKIPRRDRPPIQECLRRGDEIAVQVLKEGVGTKGPTLTSYLSIPGRFLVMMPSMDRVGVSRKVEDEETRRKMREILDQLELPDGFGFILRTAGMERTKAELKRDLAYLQRLWKDMEKRRSKGRGPRLLYSESDLLVRALRDMLTTEIERIVIDDETALHRAARFLKIVAPRSATRLVRYTGKTPIFHATGIEPQIRNIHSREVPLPGGGRLVIDETEAVVAIDVNSGKMRDARDSETNAYRTNLEAADEICRQLRLRDLGGIVINDLIDMRSFKHRREIEHRFKENLKHDRARTTLESISDFGILEMTRQRMRGSHESVHFADCPTCHGRGLVQKPDSVAADAMRELAALVQHQRVARVEMVVSPRIAGELLSGKRRALGRVERTSGRHVDVRVSEAVPVDRVTFYAYDERGADIDVSRLPAPRGQESEFVPFDAGVTDEEWAVEPEREAAAEIEHEPEPLPVELPPLPGEGVEGVEAEEAPAAARGAEEGGRRRRRRRRRGRGGREGEARPAVQAAQPPEGRAQPGPAREGAPLAEPVAVGAPQVDGAVPPMQPQREGEGGRRRRRRRRRGRGRDGQPLPPGPTEPVQVGEPSDRSGEHEAEAVPVEPASAPVEFTMPRYDPAAVAGDHGDEVAEGPAEPVALEPVPQGDGAPIEGGERRGKRRRRRRRRGGGGGGGRGAPGEAPAHAAPTSAGPSEADDAMDQIEQASDEAGVPESVAVGDHGEHGDHGGPPGDDQDGGRRRRRRRRRRRGGGGGGGGEGGPRPEQAAGHARHGAPERPHHGPPSHPAPQHREHGHHESHSPAQGSSPSRPAPTPASHAPAHAPTSAAGAPKPVRTLYSSRRKLLPSERGKIKPE
jgi:ribonuclease E